MIQRILVLAFALAGLSGCGGFSCSDQGKCKNDAAPSTSEISSCQSAITDKACGDKARALYACAHDNEQCDASGSRDDLGTLGKCTQPLAELQSCCTSNPSSAACTGG